VQLGVLAALNMDSHPPTVAALPWLNNTLPELASVLAFELHAHGDAGRRLNSQFAVRAFARAVPASVRDAQH
jgi:hypothetical protein